MSPPIFPYFPWARLLQCGPHIHSQPACCHLLCSQTPGFELDSTTYLLCDFRPVTGPLSSLICKMRIRKVPTSKVVIQWLMFVKALEQCLTHGDR